jgi:hypothetical protein
VKRTLVAAAILLSAATRLPAPPPLVTSDVPTADKYHFELYVGRRYQENENGKHRASFHLRKSCMAFSDRQELRFETALVSVDHVGLKWEFGPFPGRKEE